MTTHQSLFCPKCGGPTTNEVDPAPAGELYIAEEGCADGYAFDITEFYCPACNDSFYANVDFGQHKEKDPAERAAEVKQEVHGLFAKAGLDFNDLTPDPNTPGLFIRKSS